MFWGAGGGHHERVPHTPKVLRKLKQKAENKRRELEESRRRGKENVKKEQLNVINQERLLRKRRIPAGNDTLSSSPSTQDGEENVSSQGTDEEQPEIIDDRSDNSRYRLL